MNVKSNQFLAAIAVGLGCFVAVGDARAESNTALHNAALRDVCIEHGGRFERSWIYNDQGLQWGEVLTCSTGTGHVTCHSNVCRSGRWVMPDGVSRTGGNPHNNDDAAQFLAARESVSAALARLSGN